MTRVSFHELAERELNDAARYYEQESTGLGTKFLNEVERCIDAIVKNPSAGRKLRAQVRRRILRRFPYVSLTSRPLSRRPLYPLRYSWHRHFHTR